jgi:transcriptional regulator with XRE-family HTH domain
VYLTDEAVGAKIEELLGDTSQRELAGAIEMHPSALNRALKGERRLDLSELVAIADFLGVEPTTLIAGDQPVFAMRAELGNDGNVAEAVEKCSDLIEDFLTYRALAGR